MSNYCHCKFSFENARKEPAPDGWQAKEAWVCNRCDKPHHAVQEKGRNVRGPKDATALLHASGRRTGVHELTWATPRGHITTIEYYPYPRKVNMENPEPLLFSLWELLQSKMPLVMEKIDPWSREDSERLKAQTAVKSEARGIAEALAILMQPFVADADEVVRHAVKFYKDNDHEVPGLGTHLWNPLYNADGTYRTKVTAEPVKRTRTAVKAPSALKPKMSPGDIEFAKAGLDSGMFSLDDLAGMFKISPAEVQAAIS